MDSEQLKTILPDVVALIETKASYGAALAMSQSGMSVAMDNREQRATRDRASVGVVLTAAHGGYLVEYATSTLDRDGLLAETRAWLDGLSAPPADAPPLQIDPGPALCQDYITPMEIDPATVAVEEKFARVAARQARARALDPRIGNATVSYNESYEETVFANRARLLQQKLVRLRTSTSLLVRDDSGNIQHDWDIAGGSLGFELFDRVERDNYPRSLEALRN